MRSPNELADHFRHAKDASGHEHEPAGSPVGGRFTGGEGQSPDEMAAKLSSAKKAPSRDDMINFLMDNGGLEGDDDAIDAMSDQQIAQAFAKAKTPQAKAAPVSAGRGEKVGVLGKPSPHGSIAGRFDENNMPQTGETIAYYDGEGGGSRDAELVGPAIEARDGLIRVKSRTGSAIWIAPEAARPHQTKQNVESQSGESAAFKAIAGAGLDVGGMRERFDAEFGKMPPEEIKKAAESLGYRVSTGKEAKDRLRQHLEGLAMAAERNRAIGEMGKKQYMKSPDELAAHFRHDR